MFAAQGIERICVTVLAHNEEKRLARCLQSLPLGDTDVVIHVVVNGSTDQTAERARRVSSAFRNVHVHEFEQGGKSRSWNRIVLDTFSAYHSVHVFVDGDAEILPGSINALADALEANPLANAASGLPVNGRNVQAYRAEMRRMHGMFGDLYALRGDLLMRMKNSNIRLPEDLVGDDSLIGALAKTNLADSNEWTESRIYVCEKAEFICETISFFKPRSWQQQYLRMISYSIRHFQTLIMKEIMRNSGPAGLPHRMADLYPEHLAKFSPRAGLHWWFDRRALPTHDESDAFGRHAVPVNS